MKSVTSITPEVGYEVIGIIKPPHVAVTYEGGYTTITTGSDQEALTLADTLAEAVNRESATG